MCSEFFHSWHLQLCFTLSSTKCYWNWYLDINPFRQIIFDDEKLILCEMLQSMVHFSLSDRWMFILVSRKRCECSRERIDAIQALSMLLCRVCVWQNETFLYRWSTAAPTTIWCQTTGTHKHAQKHIGRHAKWLNTSTLSHTWWQTQCSLYHTQVHTHPHTQTHKPTIIRHCVTVAVQGETEKSFDRVSDNVQCLLLHSFSITRQYARSTLAAANSFSLADLNLWAGLPISSLLSGFLE